MKFYRPTLPIFLTKSNKHLVGIVWFSFAALLYITSNHFKIFEPFLLKMSFFDQIIPFIPETVWIYVTEYFLFISVYLFTKDLDNTNKYLYSFMGLQTFSVLIFWIFPTTFPRHLYPLSENLDPLTYFLFTQLRALDNPSNCLPSLHISSCYLSAFVFLDEQKEKFIFYFLWASLIGLSTLTTKQHYIIDVVAGFACAVLFYWIFHRWIRYKPN